MILNKHPRYGFERGPDDGFWISGKDLNECLSQLKDYGNTHPDKWIYYYDEGTHPGKPVPIATNIIEVSIYDKKPAELMLFYSCFQKGSDGLYEEVTHEILTKQMAFFAMLSDSFSNDKSN